MDSRIEELALVICERAKASSDNIRSAAGAGRGDLYHNYKRLQRLAEEMIDVVNDYRRNNPKEYLDTSTAEAVKAAVLAEREQCAEVAEGFDSCDPKYIAEAIRNGARPETMFEKSARWAWPDGRPDL